MLEWTIGERAAGVAEVRLRGAITEAVSFDALTVDAPSVVLVADGVRYVNSQGVQRLVALVARLAERGEVHAERCSPAIVAQLNWMPSLADKLTVHSVIAPLECTECVAETDILVPVEAGAGIPVIGPRACEVCGAPMVLGELEERYFSFLAP